MPGPRSPGRKKARCRRTARAFCVGRRRIPPTAEILVVSRHRGRAIATGRVPVARHDPGPVLRRRPCRGRRRLPAGRPSRPGASHGRRGVEGIASALEQGVSSRFSRLGGALRAPHSWSEKSNLRASLSAPKRARNPDPMTTLESQKRHRGDGAKVDRQRIDTPTAGVGLSGLRIRLDPRSGGPPTRSQPQASALQTAVSASTRAPAAADVTHHLGRNPMRSA